MKHDNIWAFSIEEIEEYFASIGAAKLAGGFCMEGCRIELTALPEKEIGKLRFPQTRVLIEGEKAEDVFKAFRLNFLSGGA